MRGNIQNKLDAQKILDICENGEYEAIINGKKKRVSLEEIKSAEFISSSDLEKLRYEEVGNCDNIVVTENSAIHDIIALSKKYDNKSIGVLNFASSYYPGGGFLIGSMAQEEALCHGSTLYKQLKECKKLYTENKRANSNYYTDNMALSRTQFIRNDSGIYLAKPITATVVTSAAVNINRLSKEETRLVKEIMSKRMHKIIQLFIREKTNIIILGAFGCGVFKNDPNMIAQIWKDELLRYGKHFDIVCFSILGSKYGNNNNYNIFCNYF